jgi:uncharacterized damage-inducible protein DinB
MFRKVEDFKENWKQEAAYTIKVFDAIPDQHANQAIVEGHRTLRRLAWHLVETAIELPNHFGIVVDGHEMIKNMFICDPPATMAEVKTAYEKASASLLKGMDSWTDETLQQEDNMYGMQFKRGASLWMLTGHQIHHRGEMVVLIRQAGLVPPDIYGPTKEGWAVMDMEPPSV